MTDGKTQLVGLIGWPVEHSLSPAMHNAAFDALGLNWHYVPLPVPPPQIERAVHGLGALGFRGANVTVPHKQAVMSAVDSLSTDAQTLGAANTLLVNRAADGSNVIGGHNTDVDGFVGALRNGGFETRASTNSIVVGAGGAARAVVYGLLRSGAGDITVLNRTPQRAEALIADLSHDLRNAARLRALPLTAETLIECARTADLLVNASSAGMWPRAEVCVWPDGVPIPPHLTVFDLVYNPLETRLLRQARRSGAHPIDGLGMLVLQGAIAFQMWTGKGPLGDIVPLMRGVCERTLIGG